MSANGSTSGGGATPGDEAGPFAFGFSPELVAQVQRLGLQTTMAVVERFGEMFYRFRADERARLTAHRWMSE